MQLTPQIGGPAKNKKGEAGDLAVKVKLPES
jgi:hypothetical protein